MKRDYVSLTMTSLHVEMTGRLLTGSITAVPIQIGSVTVKDFEAGFDEGGAAHNDFKDISFD